MAKILIGIDTNILVRYFVQDDKEQAQIATLFLESLSKQNQGFISSVVVIELIWVLKGIYKQSREEIAFLLEELFYLPTFQFEHHELLIQCLNIYKESNADFSDLLIQQIHQKYGCFDTVTFDKRACQKAGMKLLVL